MINTTDQILIIDEDRLLKEIKDSFIEASHLLKTHTNTKNNAFISIVDNEDYKNINLTFFDNIMEFLLNQNHENIFFTHNLIKNNNLLDKPSLRNGTKLLLLSLWKKGVLLLPLSFKMPRFNDDSFLSYFDNEVIKEIKKDVENNNYGEYFSKKYIPNISKVIRSTNFKKLENINLQEINEMHIYTLKSKKGVIQDNVPSVNYYFEHFLSFLNKFVCLKWFNEIEYKSWLSGFFSRHKELDYLSYLSEKEDLQEYRKNYVNEQTKNRNITNKRKLEKEFEIKLIKDSDGSIEELFFHVLKNHSWNNNIPVFDDYGFQNKDYDLWINLYEKYIENRKRNGYESEKSFLTSFNFLMNYIFFYLKAYKLNKKQNIEIPFSPKDFHRVLYINKSLNQSNEESFLTIKDILDKLNIAVNVKNTRLRHIKQFFDFIIDFYDEDTDIWVTGKTNPIRKNDFYIERGKSKKTNKNIVPKNVYSKLKKYLFSIEYYGEYLLDKALNDEINISSKSTEVINTENYGFTPVFFDKGQCYPLFEIPNIYLNRERTFNISNFTNKDKELIVSKNIPMNTVIRAFILMLNTGLRGAQVAWLDRDSWNINDSNKLNAYYKINVNTDKTKDHEWSSFVSHAVYQSLIKETEYQNSMREETTNKPVNYQNRKDTRFKNIQPLFRGYFKSGLPVDFRNYWTDILWSFQNNLNKVDEKKYSFITIEKPKNDRIEVIGNENLKYSPLSIKSIYTPHSMRATFCTHMAEYLERSEIAALVGHQSDLITSEVYIKPEESTIMKKMDEALDIFENGVNSDYFKKESVAHTKPNAKNSSLQQAFAQDRDQTIELFNISSISMNINKESEEQSKKAIELLKNSRMDHIIFETTHICPVGGICPQEVMGIIGEKRRCGLCPLALKCVDNLNPIYAKQRDLIREIKEDKAKLDKAIENNESEITLNNIEDKVNMDIRELVSWKFSADILSQHYEALRINPNLQKEYFVEMPDMVKNHLQKVSVSNEKEYLLTRIADSNAYSVYSNGENKYQAEMIKRNVIRNLNLIEYEDYYVSDDEKIEVFCAMISNMMETNGVNLKELIEYDCFKAIEQKKEKKQLLFKDIKLLK